jgi:glycosyltransferase involved in cell wall biosynthesis
MSTLCFIIPCMGRLTNLQQTLGSVVAQPDSSVVLVDYSCPEKSGEWVPSAHPEVRVVRETGQTIFNLSRARNLGASVATEEWLCFCDADILFSTSFASTVLPILQPGHYYRPDRLDDLGLWGTFICRRSDFEKVGGFDEVYQGWGETDMDMYDLLHLGGVMPRNFSASLLQHLPHSDAERVNFYENKNRWLNCSINRLYRMMKNHLMRIGRKTIPRNVREQMYRTAILNVNAAMEDNQPREISLELGDIAPMPGDWAVSCSLRFQYHPIGVKNAVNPDRLA